MEFTYSTPGEVKENSWGCPSEWRDNYTFEASIQLSGHYRGRSAARVKCKNLDNQETYSFALGAFFEAVTAFGVSPGGKITGKWTFRKQGANYGLYPVVESA